MSSPKSDRTMSDWIGEIRKLSDRMKEIYSKETENLLFKRLRVQSYQEVMNRDYKQQARLTRKQ